MSAVRSYWCHCIHMNLDLNLFSPLLWFSVPACFHNNHLCDAEGVHWLNQNPIIFATRGLIDAWGLVLACCTMDGFRPGKLRDHWHFSKRLLVTSIILKFHTFKLGELLWIRKAVNNDLYMSHRNIS